MSNVAVKENKRTFWSQILKGLLLSSSITLVAILLFALLIQFASINSNVIMPVNQVIKMISIFFGVFVALKSNPSKGWLKGIIIGMLYTVFSYLLFSVLMGSFTFNYSMLNDLLFSAIIGAICGILSVNLRLKNKHSYN